MPTSRRRFLVLTGSTLLGAASAQRLFRTGLGTASAQTLPGSATFRGNAGKSIQGPATLNAGMTVLRAQHNGSGNFTATLFLPNPAESVAQSDADVSYTDSWLVYDQIGAYKGGSVAMTGTPGDHYLDVTAAGAFQISIEQPLPETVSAVQQTTFSDRGKDITPYFTLPSGLSVLSVQTANPNFRGWLYHLDDLGGGPLPDGVNVYDGRFFDFTFPGNQPSYPVNLPDAGPYLLATDNIGPTDSWTFTFQ